MSSYSRSTAAVRAAPHALHRLLVEVANLLNDTYDRYLAQVASNPPLYNALIAIRGANGALSEVKKSLLLIEKMEERLTKARRQLTLSLDSTVDILARSPLGTQISGHWYKLLPSLPPPGIRSPAPVPIPSSEQDHSSDGDDDTDDDTPPALHPLSPPSYHHGRLSQSSSQSSIPPRLRNHERSASPPPRRPSSARSLEDRLTSPLPSALGHPLSFAPDDDIFEKGFRGSREAYLHKQESKYGRDKDGEVREIDNYLGPLSDENDV
ncbi:hypothetical protein DICSQDRAFT_172537 [Dichomitus squalens LYAD-421 SS1]|uniref:Uncharacterized protein n=1 Tax=Dichomitus squalens (strain LYAD-421) TaxID=732165 RepID=R7SV74_DICSQ|nr:uncharacterized protein DICSQDRAFT_172537 [Dichomitus squalens LYAD-421 SS1]EJF58877.1 hypothetical protein DICSQDRAFT_172537 [Dichomitus squalens LYAD-421 SS1]